MSYSKSLPSLSVPLSASPKKPLKSKNVLDVNKSPHPLEQHFFEVMSRIGGFETKPRLAIAVSGGSDSIALLHLAQRWAESRQGKVIALTVDHGLRANSLEEAKQVQTWCAQLGIEHHLLQWHPGECSTAIQASARKARYQLMNDWCRAQGVLHLLTAHHKNDQAETVLLRLASGSGLIGLAAMPALSISQSIRLIRPLLYISKDYIVDYLATSSIEWIEDASNQLDIYTRNRLRKQLAIKEVDQATRLAIFFAKIRNLLENKKASCSTHGVFLYPEGYAFINSDLFRQKDRSLIFHTLSGLIDMLSGAAYSPRQSTLNQFFDELETGTLASKRTIAGCIISQDRKRGGYWVFREFNAIEGEITVKTDDKPLWDKRFLISHTAPQTSLTMKALAPQGLAILKTQAPHLLPKDLSAAIFYTFPSFWNLEELVAVPHIGYVNPRYSEYSFSARFRPAKPLAGMGFFGLNDTNTLGKKETQYA
ncbi:MAG: tRNA lysidine(34) synthetase TilS [Rickettsiales bacterium]|nr:tRNA lysidine(34) synthetase TilS [Rickettsiales bacterium]